MHKGKNPKSAGECCADKGIGNRKIVSGGTTLHLGKTKPTLPKNGNHP